MATLVLAGEADAESAPELHRLVTDATRSSLRQFTLDLTDLTFIRNRLGTVIGDPSYLWYLDYNNDGRIDSFDYSQARSRNGRRI